MLYQYKKLDLNLSVILLGADGDYTAGPYHIMFSAGDNFPLEGCTLIPTNDDNVLEGDHDFSVGVDDISPDGAVTVSGANITVTITDNDGRNLFKLVVSYASITKTILFGKANMMRLLTS